MSFAAVIGTQSITEKTFSSSPESLLSFHDATQLSFQHVAERSEKQLDVTKADPKC